MIEKAKCEICVEDY